MDKNHFYEGLTRWRHLRFNDVVVRERPDTQAWNKQNEIYLLDKTRLSAQRFIRTTRPAEDISQVLAQYVSWLQGYNDSECATQTTKVELNSAPDSRLNENYQSFSASLPPGIHTGGPQIRITRRLS